MENISYRKLFGVLLNFLGTDKTKFLIWNIPTIFSNSFYLIQPVLIGSIIDFFTKYTNGQPLNQFYTYVAIFLIGSIIAEAFRLSAKAKMFEISADLEYNIKTRGFDNIQNNSLSWQSKENSGNKLQRIETGKEALLNLVDLIKNDLFYIAISFIGILSFFSIINIYLFLFFVLYIIICLLLISFWNRKNPEVLNNLNNARERSSGKLFEGLNNLLTIKSLGATQSFQTSINNTQDEVRSAVKKWERLGIYKWFSISTLDIIFLSSFFILIAYGVVSGIITVGLVFVLYTYFDKLQSITVDLNNKVTKLIEIKSKVERMLPVFEVSNFQRGEKSFPQKWDEIKIENASFEYSLENGKALFEKINFTVSKGEFVGIIGESGSGKSSLLKVLLGLYPISSGNYYIGKRDFYDIEHKSLLEKITVVLQDTELFNISLLDNITMFKKLNLNLLNKALKVAALDDVIESLPEGINTIIGEKGQRLSGGQRQRIGIARAIYKDSEIILMDESTSNLDPETEGKVINNILNELEGKTIIAVAHRLSTLEKAVHIYKFEGGKLIKQLK